MQSHMYTQQNQRKCKHRCKFFSHKPMYLPTYQLQSQNACLLAAGWQASQSITKSRDSGETLWNGMEVADSARLLEVISMETDSQAPTLPSALILKTSCFWCIYSHGHHIHPRQFTANGKIKIGIIWLDSAIN